MSSPKKPLLWYLVGLLIVSFALGIYLLKSPKEAPQLRIGLTPWNTFEYIFLAKHRGFFQEFDVDVRILEFETLQDLRRAYVRGQVDGIGSTPIEMVQTNFDSNKTLQVVLFTDFSNGADVILARKPIASVTDLKGKKIGVEIGSLGIFVLYKALEKYGLTLDDVLVVPSDQAQLVERFHSGSMDAVVTFPPFSLKLTNEQTTNTVFSTAEIPRAVPSLIAFDAKVVKERSEDISKFILAFEKAKVFASREKGAFEEMAKRQQITTEDFMKGFDGIEVIGLEENLRLLGDKDYMSQTHRAALEATQKAKIVPEVFQLKETLWDAAPATRAHNAGEK